MPLPLVPLAGVALTSGGVALAAWFFARRLQPARIDQRAEDALDDLPEGLAARRPADRDQANMSGRFRRIVRLPGDGGAIEIDAAFLARFRARRV
jgi:hypothetical protein